MRSSVRVVAFLVVTDEDLKHCFSMLLAATWWLLRKEQGPACDGFWSSARGTLGEQQLNRR